MLAERQNLAVQFVRYDLPTDRDHAESVKPPPVTPGVLPSFFPAPDTPAEGTELPPTGWLRHHLFRVKPELKLLLVRTPIDSNRTDDFVADGTVGVGLMITGIGAHVRYSGEAGLHMFSEPPSPDPANPDVLVFVSHEALLSYRPPETVVRKGFLRDRTVRRTYDREKGELRDYVLERNFTARGNDLAYLLEPAIVASMRTRLLRLIVE